MNAILEKIKPLLRPTRRNLIYGGAALVCLLLLIVSLVIALEPNHCRILEGVRIGNVDVGGMSPFAAYGKLRSTLKPLWAEHDLTVELPEATLTLSQKDAHVDLRYGAAIRDAYRCGRRNGLQQNPLSLRPYLKADEKAIRSLLETYAAQYDTVCTPSSYRLEGAAPNLDRAAQTGSDPCQTLVITIGIPTRQLDIDSSLERILTAYAETARTVTDFPVNILEEPAYPDVDAIYQECFIAPVDDALDMEAYEAIPGAFGYHFDLEQANKLVGTAQYGDVVSIPMAFLEPDIAGDGVYFRDVLGYCETPHTKDENRNHNLALACQSMNGVILQPGEVFSYNDTLGQRTPERGYRRAGAYSGWELVQAYGGGICQGSSTIYGAALSADLEIVQRRNHGYMVSYVEPGLDATVNWGGPDFQFRNNTHFPIKIAAEVSDGYVKVSILGTEERDYYIKMESEATWGEETIYATSYRCKYHRETEELISRELEARSHYAR